MDSIRETMECLRRFHIPREFLKEPLTLQFQGTRVVKDGPRDHLKGLRCRVGSDPQRGMQRVVALIFQPFGFVHEPDYIL